MATVTRVIAAPPEQVWAVLADGWLYPGWVVGASRMREVDAAWPEPGSRLHHSVGAWPLLVDDTTEVIESRPAAHLRLAAHVRPGGTAVVDLRLAAHPDGTEVVMTEDLTSGPGVLVPRPARDPLLAWRNTETLRRLAYLSERRPAGGP